MKQVLVAWFVLFIALSVSACGGITVDTDWDHEVDFASYKSFSWMEPGADSARVNQLVENRIKNAVIEQMRALGYTEDTANPDVFVTYLASVEAKVDVSTTTYGYWRGSAVGDVDVYNYNEGTLLLDIIDVAKNQLVWRGTGTGVIGSDAGSQDKINKAVQQILSRYPPQ